MNHENACCYGDIVLPGLGQTPPRNADFHNSTLSVLTDTCNQHKGKEAFDIHFQLNKSDYEN